MNQFTDNTTQVSVIMPVYNAEDFLAIAINSVLNQTFKSFELIIINDGSTDTSHDIISTYKDPRIVYIRQENQGQTKASNVGINKAKGKYIKFLDADDAMNILHLEAQYTVMNNSKDILVSSQWAYFYKDTSKVEFEQEVTNQDYNSPVEWFYESQTLGRGMLGAWLWLIPRILLDNAGYWNENLTLNNDYDFSIRLLCASKGVRFASDAKIYYRKGVENAITKSKSYKAMASAIDTTVLGMHTMLEMEDSNRMRLVFANRFQDWIYQMYPSYPALIELAEQHIIALGGSNLKPRGGLIFESLNKLLGWRFTYLVQKFVYKYGWSFVLKFKESKKKQDFIRKGL